MTPDGVRIGAAIPSDKEPVLEFCKNTWPGGDYISEVWDDWLRDRGERLVVATVKNRPVGIGHGYFQTRNIVWLEGLRVHPDYRGQGIAGKLNKSLVKWAVDRGASIARLSTGSVNIASQRHAAKVGFSILAAFQRLDSEKSLHRKPQGIKRTRKYRPGFWKWLTSSREFQEFHGLYSDGWTWYPLSPATFRRLVSRGNVLQTTRAREPGSCLVFLSEGRRLTIGFVAGEKTDVEREARYLWYLLSRGSYDRVRALVPRDSGLVENLEEAGFQRTSSIVVYEKKLRGKLV